MRRRCRTDAMFRHRKRANWACRCHMVEQWGWCGICLEPMRVDEIETWAVSRIRPEWAGGRPREGELSGGPPPNAPRPRERSGRALRRLGPEVGAVEAGRMNVARPVSQTRDLRATVASS